MITDFRSLFGAGTFFYLFNLYTTRASPVGIPRDIYSILFIYFYVIVLLYVSSVVWWELQGLVTFRLFMQHVLDVLD